MGNPYTITTDDGRTGFTEAGMYWKALTDGETERIEFVKWVCCEVLPAIRKNGFYNCGFFQGDELFKSLETIHNCNESLNEGCEPNSIDPKRSFSYQVGLVGCGGNPIISVRDVGGNVWVSVEELFSKAPWTGQAPHRQAVEEILRLKVECKGGETTGFASYPELNTALGGRLDKFSTLADVVGKEDRSVN